MKYGEKEENKIDGKKVASKGKKKGIIIGSISAGVLAATGVAMGIVLSQPKYLNFTVDSIGILNVNGEDDVDGKYCYKEGDTIILQTENIEGYSFDGWYRDGVKIPDATQLSYEFKLTKQTQGDYEARFSKINYSILIASGNESDISSIKVDGVERLTAGINDVVSFLALDKSSDGKSMAVYYRISDEEQKHYIVASEGKYTFTMPAKSVEIGVDYELIDYTITGNSTTNGSFVVKKDGTIVSNANKGDMIEIIPSANQGYKVKKVSRLYSGETDWTVITIDSDRKYKFEMGAGNVQIKVEFERERYDVIAGSEEIVDISSEFAFFEDEISFTVMSRESEGYKLTRVYYTTDGGETKVDISCEEDIYTFVMPTSDVEIFAEFSNVYSISSNTSITEYITGLASSAQYNTIVSFSIQREGYTPTVYYIANGESTHHAITASGGVYSFAMPAKDVTIYAEFSLNRYMIDSASTSNGTFDIKCGTHIVDNAQYNANVQVVCHPNSNYKVGEVYYTFNSDATNAKHTISLSSGQYQFFMPAGSITVHVTFIAFSQVAEVGGLSYALNNITQEATITGFGTDSFNQNLVIPATINVAENNNTSYKVVAIRDADAWTKRASGASLTNGAFQNQAITTLDLTNATNLKKIGSGAFANTKITEITLPSSIEEIGAFAFRSCSDLVEADFSEATSLQVIPYGCFYVDNGEGQSLTYSLTTFLAPSSLTKVESDAFYLSGVTTIDLSACQNLSTIEANAFENAINLRSVKLAQGKEATPTTIAAEAFKGATSLLTIVLPKYATIADDVFSGATSLVELVQSGGDYISTDDLSRLGVSSTSQIPAGMAVSIVDQSQVRVGKAFAYYVVEGVPYIFHYFGSNTELNLNTTALNQDLSDMGTTQTYTSFAIHKQAFKDNSSITKVTIGQGVVSIEEKAFNGCSVLGKVDMTNAGQLTTIGANAFLNCSKVTELSFPTAGNIATIGGSAFCGMNGVKALDLSAQSDLTVIEASTFREMKRVESIVLPNSITSIGSQAFCRCDRLLTLTIPASVASLSVDVFKTSSNNHSGACHLLEITNLSTNESVVANLQTAISRINNANGFTHIMGEDESSRITRTYAKISNKNETDATPIIMEGTEYDSDAGEFIWYQTSDNNMILVGWYGSSQIMDANHELVLPTKSFNYSLIKNFNHFEEKTTKITIPSCVTEIGDYSFQSCKGLKTVILEGNPDIGQYAFQFITINTNVYIDDAQVYANLTTLPSGLKDSKVKIYVKKSIIYGGTTNSLFTHTNADGDYYLLVEA